MSKPAAQTDDGEEMGVDVAARYLEVTVGYVRDLLSVGALSARTEGGVELIRRADLDSFAAEQARRRPFMETIGEIGSEQMENERRQGLI